MGRVENAGSGDDLMAAPRMSSRARRRALVDPRPSMPSCEGLQRADLDAIVAYIRGLDG